MCNHGAGETLVGNGALVKSKKELFQFSDWNSLYSLGKISFARVFFSSLLSMHQVVEFAETVDDHATVRRSVCALLRGDPAFDVICDVAEGIQAEDRAEESNPMSWSWTLPRPVYGRV